MKFPFRDCVSQNAVSPALSALTCGLPLIQKSVPLANILVLTAAAAQYLHARILQQLGELLVGAIPTALLFIVLVIAYQFLVQGPLTAVLAKRRALTEGAMEDARKAIAEAEAKAAEYAERLRQARAELQAPRAAHQAVERRARRRPRCRPQGGRRKGAPGQGRARRRSRRRAQGDSGLGRRSGRPGRPRRPAAAAGGSR